MIFLFSGRADYETGIKPASHRTANDSRISSVRGTAATDSGGIVSPVAGAPPHGSPSPLPTVVPHINLRQKKSETLSVSFFYF